MCSQRQSSKDFKRVQHLFLLIQYWLVKCSNCTGIVIELVEISKFISELLRFIFVQHAEEIIWKFSIRDFVVRCPAIIEFGKLILWVITDLLCHKVETSQPTHPPPPHTPWFLFCCFLVGTLRESIPFSKVGFVLNGLSPTGRTRGDQNKNLKSMDSDLFYNVF